MQERARRVTCSLLLLAGFQNNNNNVNDARRRPKTTTTTTTTCTQQAKHTFFSFFSPFDEYLAVANLATIYTECFD
jgi:hypothetical protein